jgi:hypothetical protein
MPPKGPAKTVAKPLTPPVRPVEGSITLPPAAPPARPVEGKLTLPPSPAPVRPVEGKLTPVSARLPEVVNLPAPSKPQAPAKAAASPPARPIDGKLTTAPAPGKQPPAPASVRLKDHIQEVCGPAYDIRVTARGTNGLLVNCSAPNESEGRKLLDKITPVLRLPEFASFEIDVDVKIPSK